MPMNMRSIKTSLLGLAILAGFAMQGRPADARDIQTTIVAGGCFWCVESDFERVNGVIDVVSGFAGGTTPNPTYKQVTAGGTGHYEVVQITYDADVVSYDQLLHMFFRSVDPTDAGGQFCDRGASYRTAVFVRNQAEANAATTAINAAQRDLGQRVVTPIIAGGQFTAADAYHQDYYKGAETVLTRRGPKSKSEAYKFYRDACGRDARVNQLWGSAAPFTH